jgi:hypothetical protein
VTEIIPRFEFRVWGVGLDGVRRRLLEKGDLYERRQSNETYVVSKMEGVNVKIRAGIVDIKELIVVHGRLERWKPVFKAAFPLSAEVVAKSVLLRLGVEEPVSMPHSVNEEEFIFAVKAFDELIVVQVHKDRSLVRIGLCRGESSRVQVNGAVYETIAVESADPEAVEETVADLGIDDRPNESYPAMIRGLEWA